MKNGNVLWKYNINENLNSLKNIWNENYPLSSWPLASPLLLSGENIFVLSPHSITNINRLTGKEIWLHRDDTPIVNVTNLTTSNDKLFFGRYYGSDMSNTAFLAVLNASSGKEIFSNEKGPWPFKSNDYFDQNYFISIDNITLFAPSKSTVTAYKSE